MLDKYCVVTKKGYSVSDIDLELISDGGSETIPQRKVDIAEAHPNTQRTTVFYLTDEEARQIANDPRVLSVELHPESNPNVKIDKLAVDDRDYARNGLESNWGLKRHSTNQMNFYNADRTVNTSQTSNTYTYNNAGEGVDIIVIDTGVQADHPDFLDENGSMTSKADKQKAVIYFTRASEAKKAAMNNKTRPFFGFSRKEQKQLSSIFFRNIK